MSHVCRLRWPDLGHTIECIVRKHSLSFFFAVAGTVIAIARLSPYSGWGDDWAAYVEQGIALTTGTIPQQQLDMRFCLDNSAISLGPHAYPWGMPLAIAFLFPTTGFSVVAFKSINLVFWGPFLFLFHAVSLRRTNRSIASVLTLLFVVHPVFLAHVNVIGSDIPFLFFAFSSVLALESLVSKSNRRPGILCLSSVLGSIACVSAFLFRTNGVVILVALACMQMFAFSNRLFPDSKLSRILRDSVRLSGPMWIQVLPFLFFFVCALLLKEALTLGGDGHLAMLSRVSLRTLLGHSLHYTKVAANWFALPGLSRSIVLGAIIVILSGSAGFAVFRTNPMEVLFVLGTALCYVIWPEKQGIRFLFPLIPFVLLWIGEIVTSSATSRPRVANAIASLAIIVLAHFCIRTVQAIRHAGTPMRDDPFASDATSVFSFIRSNTPDHAIIDFRKPRALHLLTRRRSYVSERETIRSSPNRLLLVDRINDPPDWVEAVEQKIASGSFLIRFENSQFILLDETAP